MSKIVFRRIYLTWIENVNFCDPWCGDNQNKLSFKLLTREISSTAKALWTFTVSLKMCWFSSEWLGFHSCTYFLEGNTSFIPVIFNTGKLAWYISRGVQCYKLHLLWLRGSWNVKCIILLEVNCHNLWITRKNAKLFPPYIWLKFMPFLCIKMNLNKSWCGNILFVSWNA